jgi:anti-anti-sigma factor
VLREALAEQLGRAGDVVLDLSDVSFMDSSGLGVLMAGSQMFSDGGGGLRVSSRLVPQVRRLLELTGVIDVLNLVEDFDAPAPVNRPGGP